MKRYIFIAAALVLATVSCSKVYDATPVVPADRAIGFDSWTESLTKATVENTFEVGDDFKVWGEKSVSSTPATVFDGVTVTKGSSAWTYDTKQYWDMSAESYTFYGVSPAADGYTVSPSTGAVTASPTIEFTGKDSDILVAQKKVVNQTDGSGNFNSFHTVDMSFNHVAALLDVKVRISAGLVAAGATVKVSSIEVQNLSTKGTFTVAGGYTTAPAATWTSSEAAAATTGTFDSDDGFVDASARLNTALDGTGAVLIEKLVVMPQNFRSTGDYIQKIDIDYNITQSGGAANNFTPAAIQLASFDSSDDTANDGTHLTGWAPGIHYTYIITIDANAIEFTATIDTNWGTDTEYYYLVN